MPSDKSTVAAIGALLNHDFYTYDLNLRFKWSPTGANILPRLQTATTYIVDNNLSWKKLAAAHPDKNFVLGGTISDETENLEGALFSKLPPGGYPNVFSLDLIAGGRPLVVFHRVDSNYKRACFARPIPPLSNTTPGHRAARTMAADSLRFQICQFLGQDSDELKRAIDSSLPNCPGNIEQAGLAAAMTTALFLQSITPTLRTKKLDPNYMQLPGDTRLIAEALFFGFPLLSNDQRDVHAMGRITGVSVIKETDLQP